MEHLFHSVGICDFLQFHSILWISKHVERV
jgi:hypothetical protein